jgi:SAM-dependent methyltransferase
MNACISCGSLNSVLVSDLGHSPLANSHRDNEKRNLLLPLALQGCNDCTHLQIRDQISVVEIFNDSYSYLSGKSVEWRQHCVEIVESIENLANNTWPTGRNVLEIGSNDGTLLSCFSQNPLNELIIGIEPSEVPAEIARQNGINTEILLLNGKNVLEFVKKWGTFHVIVGTNVFAHTPDPLELFKASSLLLREDGYLILEVQDGTKLLKHGLFDMVYHEHYSYYTPHSLFTIARRAGLKLLALERIKTHGGSLRAIFVKDSNQLNMDAVLSSFTDSKPFDSSAGRIDLSTESRAFQKQVDDFYEWLEVQLSQVTSNNRIVGIGAPAKLTTLIHAAPTSVKKSLLDKIDFIYDSSQIKNGTFVPGTNLIIRDTLENNPQNSYWIFSWNYSSELKEYLYKIGVSNHQIVVISQNLVIKTRGEDAT